MPPLAVCDKTQAVSINFESGSYQPDPRPFAWQILMFDFHAGFFLMALCSFCSPAAARAPRRPVTPRVHPMDKSKPKTKAGTKKAGTASPPCANCGSEGVQRCGGCGQVHYCRKNLSVKDGKQINNCQREHWLHGGHKKACKAHVLAATVHAQQERECKAAVETDRGLVCLGPPREPTVEREEASWASLAEAVSSLADSLK